MRGQSLNLQWQDGRGSFPSFIFIFVTKLSAHKLAMSCSNQPNQTVPDLVHNSKLIIHSRADDVTKHIVRDSNQSHRRRSARREETWHRQRQLGSGSFGCVWLEKCISGPRIGKLRAVKEMHKDPSLPVPYMRELEAMAKFRHETVQAFLPSITIR